MRKRILIVEDNVIIAMLMEQDLMEAGYEIAGTTGNFEDSLHVAATEAADLALVDIDLEGGDSGIELARALNEKYDIPTLYITGQEAVAREHRGTALGLLAKPFSSDQLVKAVDHVFARARKESEQPDCLELFHA